MSYDVYVVAALLPAEMHEITELRVKNYKLNESGRPRTPLLPCGRPLPCGKLQASKEQNAPHMTPYKSRDAVSVCGAQVLQKSKKGQKALPIKGL